MDTLWIIIVIILQIVAMAGTIIPVLPSITIAWAGMLMLYLLVGTEAINGTTFIWASIAAIAAKALDLLLPLWGVKLFGGTKSGVNGATIGMVVALLWSFTPFAAIINPIIAMVVFPIIGAFIGEKRAAGGDNRKAWGGAWGSLLGFFLTIGIKFILIAWYLYITIAYIVK